MIVRQGSRRLRRQSALKGWHLLVPNTRQDRMVLARLGIAVLLVGFFPSPLLARSLDPQSNQSSIAERPSGDVSPSSQSNQPARSPLTLDEVIRLIKQSKSE